MHGNQGNTHLKHGRVIFIHTPLYFFGLRVQPFFSKGIPKFMLSCKPGTAVCMIHLKYILRKHPCIWRLSFPFFNCFLFQSLAIPFYFMKSASAWGHYKVLYGEANPSHYFLPFWQKRQAFRIPLIEKSTPFTCFHNWPTVLWINYQRRKSCYFFVVPGAYHGLLIVLNKINDTAIKCFYFNYFNKRPFAITTWQIFLPFHIPHLMRFLPFRQSLFVHAIIGSTQCPLSLPVLGHTIFFGMHSRS